MAKQKLCIIICSNRQKKLLKATENIITQEKIFTFFVKQNLPGYYKKHKYIHEIKTNSIGISTARNIGIKFAKNFEFIAFTDDDCIVTANWIKSIKKSFQNQKINLLFGQTLPYKPSNPKNKNKFSVCTFSKNPKLSPVTSFCKHWESIGFSNNMAARTKVLKKLKGFKTWLGPGSFCLGGEDAEFILNAINSGYPIFYNKNMIVYHNKWLNSQQLHRQYISYNSGTIGAYGLYAFQGNFFCKSIVKESFQESLKNILKTIKQISHPKSFLNNFIYETTNLFFMFRTFIITYFHHLTK